MAKKRLAVAQLHVPPETPATLKIDIGCGKNAVKDNKDGWVGVDSIDFGQAYVKDVREGLPFETDSVSEARSGHFVEHLTGTERISFFNELYRVLKVGATAQIVTPHWSHACAYGDPTHQWPPMSEWYPLYLNKGWRDVNAPHAAYTCDFDYIVAGSWDQRLVGRNPEFVQNAMNTQVNGWRDLIVTLTKKQPT